MPEQKKKKKKKKKTGHNVTHYILTTMRRLFRQTTVHFENNGMTKINLGLF